MRGLLRLHADYIFAEPPVKLWELPHNDHYETSSRSNNSIEKLDLQPRSSSLFPRLLKNSTSFTKLADLELINPYCVGSTVTHNEPNEHLPKLIGHFQEVQCGPRATARIQGYALEERNLRGNEFLGIGRQPCTQELETPTFARKPHPSTHMGSSRADKILGFSGLKSPGYLHHSTHRAAVSSAVILENVFAIIRFGPSTAWSKAGSSIPVPLRLNQIHSSHLQTVTHLGLRPGNKPLEREKGAGEAPNGEEGRGEVDIIGHYVECNLREMYWSGTAKRYAMNLCNELCGPGEGKLDVEARPKVLGMHLSVVFENGGKSIKHSSTGIEHEENFVNANNGAAQGQNIYVIGYKNGRNHRAISACAYGGLERCPQKIAEEAMKVLLSERTAIMSPLMSTIRFSGITMNIRASFLRRNLYRRSGGFLSVRCKCGSKRSLKRAYTRSLGARHMLANPPNMMRAYISPKAQKIPATRTSLMHHQHRVFQVIPCLTPQKSPSQPQSPNRNPAPYSLDFFLLSVPALNICGTVFPGSKLHRTPSHGNTTNHLSSPFGTNVEFSLSVKACPSVEVTFKAVHNITSANRLRYATCPSSTFQTNLYSVSNSSSPPPAVIRHMMVEDLIGSLVFSACVLAVDQFISHHCSHEMFFERKYWECG
ncbi:uncharacterized protein BDR25DRAFT_361812 [Lindgomyces ingoldianus]|uniref:Uncharacterized protein n=1 Tax=Lindgomyces ingoldianus TaxID=673940 RepID=A0ACB6QBH0_9PLEO|nr:uncharacterized protein BDR25DRAFT_361812 [Lindgomyces ingoldianus]KAF2464308.1 hypothetical protein BDR25DRAFT_361812 [Lindgomyces ingoldianus]